MDDNLRSGDSTDLRRSAADAVTHQLRSELLDGTIPAGSRILPKDLAERFALSIVPIREALRHLEAEGLVTTSRQRATYAADIGIEELAGVYDLRRVVEPEFADRSVRLATDDDRKACKVSFKALKNAVPHSSQFYAAHREFHWSLLAPAASPVIRTVLEKLWQSVDRYMALGAKRLPEHSAPEYIKAFNEDHEAIAVAFCQGDADVVRSLLTMHFVQTEAAMRKMFERLASNANPNAENVLASRHKAGR
jgi:DNA-binding GntR family transcriptional regulator